MVKITKIEKLPSVKKKRVAAYVRVSTTAVEQLLSFESQKTHYQQLIDKNKNWELVDIYSDEGISGTSLNSRVGLQKLLSDCDKGLIDLIITKSISRLARNMTDCLEIVRHLINQGISIWFEKENINTETMDSELMLSILSSLAENESKFHSENMKWSTKKRFENGNFVLSVPPFGYRNKNKNIVVHESEAVIVKEIFKMYLNGLGIRKITQQLNHLYPNQYRGLLWKESTVQNILKNHTYTGDMIFQKTYTSNNYKRKINRGEQVQYYVENHHESIISLDDYNKVQTIQECWKKQKRIMTETTKYQVRYVLSGKILCGCCKSKFKRRQHYNPDYIAWGCQTRLKNKEQCSMKFVREDDIQTAFINLLNKLIFGKKILEDLYIQCKQSVIEDVNIKMLQNNLDQVKKEEQAVNALRLNGVLDSKVYYEKLNAITLQKNGIQNELDYITNQSITENVRTNELLKLLHFVEKSEYLKGYDDSLIESFVSSIWVNERKVFEFQLKCGLNLKERVLDR